MTVPSFREVLAQTDHAAQGTAATTEAFVVGEVQSNSTVTEVSIVPQAALTAADTTTRTFTLQNRGTAGTGTTTVATLTTDVAGGNWVAYDEKLMTLSGTAANLAVDAGSVLAVVETVASTGATHPAFQITVRGTIR